MLCVKQAGDGKWIPKKQPYIWKDTIKCNCCGYDTGLNPNGFLMVIPPEGLRCPICDSIIIEGHNIVC